MDIALPSQTIGSQTLYLNRKIQSIAVYLYVNANRMKLLHNILDAKTGMVSITIPKLSEGVYPLSVFSLLGTNRAAIHQSTVIIEDSYIEGSSGNAYFPSGW